MEVTGVFIRSQNSGPQLKKITFSMRSRQSEKNHDNAGGKMMKQSERFLRGSSRSYKIIHLNLFLDSIK